MRVFRLMFLSGLLVGAAVPAYAAFKNFDWGSRPVGMGSAFIAVADDANAVIYNPAGLTQIETIETNFMYAKMFTGMDKVNLGLNYLTLVLPAAEGSSFGFGWTNFTSADEYKEDSFYLSYARDISDYLTAGVSLKYLGHKYILDERSRIDPVFASGSSKYQVTLDAGAMTYIETGADDRFVSFGFSARNITQPDLGLATKDIVPMELGLGVAYTMGDTIIPSVDVVYRVQEWGTSEDKLSIRVGGETWLMDHLLGLRAGFNTSQITVGIGLNPLLWNTDLQLDYSLIWPLEVKETQGSHHISLGIRFDTSESDRK